MNKMRISHLLL